MRELPKLASAMLRVGGEGGIRTHGADNRTTGLEQVILVGRLVGDHHRVADDE